VIVSDKEMKCIQQAGIGDGTEQTVKRVILISYTPPTTLIYAT